ncbi:2396_t:CDS:2, partial [Acaulospora colombiana]
GHIQGSQSSITVTTSLFACSNTSMDLDASLSSVAHYVLTASSFSTSLIRQMATKCRTCDIKFSSHSRLQEVSHNRGHLRLNIREHFYYCQTCVRTFNALKDLEKHFQTSIKHDSSDPNENMTNSNTYCRHCRRQFATSKQLKSHRAKAHLANAHNIAHTVRSTSPKCEICDKKFRCPGDLAKHLSSPVHNKRNIPCPHCSEEFKTTSGVAHHLEYRCLKKITEGVIRWDVNHLITDVEYTDRIREVDSDDDSGDDVFVPRHQPKLFKVLEVIATEEAWSPREQAYICPI